MELETIELPRKTRRVELERSRLSPIFNLDPTCALTVIFPDSRNSHDTSVYPSRRKFSLVLIEADTRLRGLEPLRLNI